MNPLPLPAADDLALSTESVRVGLAQVWRQADRWARAHPREALLFGLAGGAGVGLVGLGAIIRGARVYRPLLAAFLASRSLPVVERLP